MDGPTYKQKAAALLEQLIGDDADGDLRCQFIFQGIAVYASQIAQKDINLVRAEMEGEAGMPAELTAEKWVSIARGVELSLHDAVDRACFRSFIDSGMTEHDAIGAMKDLGASPIEVIRQLRSVCGHSLGQAKRIFSAHPAWTFENKRADKIHQEILADISPGPEKAEPAVMSPSDSRRPARARRYRHPERKSRTAT